VGSKTAAQVLFPGESEIKQMEVFAKVLGKPPRTFIEAIPSKHAQKYLDSMLSDDLVRRSVPPDSSTSF
jgi:hypothetical protein